MGLRLDWITVAMLAGFTGCSVLPGSNDVLSRRVDDLRHDLETLARQQDALSKEIVRIQARAGVTPEATAEEEAPRQVAGQTEPEPGPPSEVVITPVPRAVVETLPPAATAPQGKAQANNPEENEEAVYKDGLDLMGAGKYQQARDSFAAFILQYPQSDLADNAQYWIGECHYQQKYFKEARDAFKSVADHFPFGNKVPDALYKEALCERQLGQEDQAKATLKRLAEEFPDSEAAAKAK